MIRKSFLLLLLLSFLLWMPTYLQAQLWSGIISPARAVDWSNVGVGGGIPSGSWTQCGATIAAYSGSAATINTRIGTCSANQYVLLGAGTFTLSSGIDFAHKSNVVVRGSGADQTFLVFSGHAGCSGLLAAVCIEGSQSLYGGGSGLNPDNTATWTATSYAAGQTQITLSSIANLAAGSLLALDQCNDGLSGASCTGTESDTGNVYVCDQAAPCASLDGPSGAQRSKRGQIQIVTVTNIAGSLVTFTPGLAMPNWSAARSPGAYWATTLNKYDGVETLSLDFTNADGQAGITIWNCANCWVKGVRSIYTSHNGAAERNHVWLVLSSHITVRDSYFFGSASLHSEGYGVEVFGASDSLIENNIFQNMPSPQMINGSCEGCVVGYNYSNNDANDAAFLFNSFTDHSNANHMLTEGNIGNSYRLDYFHGSHSFMTAFRNFYNGWEPNITGGLIPLFINAQGRYTNVIGNVLGRVGVQNGYASGTAIYDLGGGNGGVADDSLVTSTLMRWGNYDTVNAANRFVAGEVPSGISPYPNPVPANNNLPPSFYRNSQPAWWGVVGQPAIPWPAIGPDVTGQTVSGTSGTTTWVSQSVGGHVAMIPAMLCYKAVMNGTADGTGSAFTFNADRCYSSATGVLAPPSGLSVVVQ